MVTFFRSDSLPLPKKQQRMPSLFQGCFASGPQGDHLGVEFAVDAHKNLLRVLVLCMTVKSPGQIDFSKVNKLQLG
jgi:hypothetical protein